MKGASETRMGVALGACDVFHNPRLSDIIFLLEHTLGDRLLHGEWALL